MRRFLTALLIVLSVPATATAKSQNTQLVLQIQQGISQYGIHADVSNLSISALAQLKGILGDKGTYLNKRNAIRHVLRKNGYNF